MIRNQLTKRLAAVALTAGIIVGTPAASFATPAEGSLDDAKARAAEEIDRRRVTLDELDELVENAEHVTGEHQAQLSADIEWTREGLSALDAEIAANTNRAEMREDLSTDC